MHSRGYPNLLMISATQSGWAINFVHILDELSQHAAHIVERCLKQGIETIEPTEQAQQQWWEVILGSLIKHGSAFGGAECTPGYYNNEGVQGGPSLMRSAAYGGGTIEFAEILRSWRNADDFRRTGVDSTERERLSPTRRSTMVRFTYTSLLAALLLGCQPPAAPPESPPQETPPPARPQVYRQEVVVPGSPFQGVHGMVVDGTGHLLASNLLGQTVHSIDLRSGAVSTLVGPRSAARMM